MHAGMHQTFLRRRLQRQGRAAVMACQKKATDFAGHNPAVRSYRKGGQTTVSGPLTNVRFVTISLAYQEYPSYYFFVVNTQKIIVTIRNHEVLE